ncbi:SMP-30/gluconolactonase/LRE family protein [Modestobacter versicolor]|uniref:SMP-30/gluconolactonase/LRE family protein n=1 Tax=Modestobacter versicolor TaxID=429133 RepID=A0A323VEA6_9ACTN|nr:SMP-30/gluconolactonase/LRE family protein [Modestobacter versicolor]MBB3678290.1 sugar lactone lactonase YvrE [Modestobacter versicolor]PZA22393.1 SMP-30/gluconolactonase/LRE family protein [Modestobacter versicolor]
MTRRLLSPRRWAPPPARPDTGGTGELVISRRLPTGGHGPEDVVFDADGSVVTGTQDGRLLRLDPATGETTVVGRTGGRPLGVQPCDDGSVLVCDHDRGLLRVRPDGGVEVLVDTVDGEPLTFASNVVAEPDGTIWFTTSTSRWDVDDHLGDLFEHSCTGRLVRRDPDGSVRTVLRGLKFANGLVLAPDGSHLLLAETSGYRIWRYWLAGARAGTAELLVEDLPGFPDNMSLGSDGLLWVAVAAPRNALLDRLLPLPGVLRQLVWLLPEALKPAAVPVAWVLAFELDGRLVHDLRLADGSYGFVTAVAERDGVLVLSSLHETDVVVVQPPG